MDSVVQYPTGVIDVFGDELRCELQLILHHLVCEKTRLDLELVAPRLAVEVGHTLDEGILSMQCSG